MTEAEKMDAIRKWNTDKQKHTKKKRDKGSHVYLYMKREEVPGLFYPEVPGGPKIFQEYRWSCSRCLAEPPKFYKKFLVLESNRKGVTSGMKKHLVTYGITKESHFARIRGYD
jgi:hypothetical protein